MRKYRVAKVYESGEVWRNGPLFHNRAIAEAVAQLQNADAIDATFQVELAYSLADYIQAGDKEGAAKKLAEVRRWIAEDMEAFAAEVD
jgi:predicted short-subunit dehydrogenase-like oxidoreductase (DUF2520 family)